MPQMFESMAEELFPGLDTETKFIGGGGATMEKHWEVGHAQTEIESGGWNYVVLQAQSSFGSSNIEDQGSADTFYQFARKYNDLIRDVNAKTVFYQTWSKESKASQQEIISDAYFHIGLETHSLVAPIGEVWDVLRIDPDLDLYNEDGSHPSTLGSYVAAYTLVRTIFGSSDLLPTGETRGFEILRGGVLAEKKSQLSNLSKLQVSKIYKAVNEGIAESDITK